MIKDKNFQLISAVLLVIVITGSVFYPIINNDFIDMDDSYYVINNELIKELSIENFLNSFHTKTAGNIHPLTIASLSVDYHFWGLNATGYHLHNLLLHILNSILVFFLIYHISAKKLSLALFTSLLFAVHPMHVESVAWISERKDVLYAFWYLSGLLSYVLFLKNKKPNFFLLTFIFFILSLLSKSAAVSFPLVLILLDYFLLNKFSFSSVLSKTLFFIISLGFGLINLQSQGILMSGYTDYSIIQKGIYSSYALIYYIIHFFIPFKLSMFHAFPKAYPVHYYISVIPVFGLFFFMVISILKKKNKNFLFGVMFYLITLFFMLHIVAFSKAVVAERYTYLAYIGIAWFVIRKLLYTKEGQFKVNHIKKLYLPFILSAIIFVFSYISYNYAGNAWKNSESIWTNTLKYYPESKIAYDSRSNYYLNKGELNKASKDIQKSLELSPKNSYALLSLAYYYYYKNQTDSAFSVINSLKDNYSYRREFTELAGMCYIKQRDFDSAEQYYDSLVFNKPNNYKFINNRAKLKFLNGKYTEALENFTSAICIHNDIDENYFYRSIIYLIQGNYKKAQEDLRMISNKNRNSKIYSKCIKICNSGI